MKISFLSLIYLLGALQGLILLLGININRSGRKEVKQAMSLLLGVVIFSMLYYIVLLNKYTTIYYYLDSLGTAAWMAICPAYYLLCCCLVNPKFRIQRRHLGYFLISAVFILEELWTSLGVPIWIYDWVDDPLLYTDIWMVLFFGTGIYFIYHSIRILRRSQQDQSIQELRWFSYALMGVLLSFSLIFIAIRTTYTFLFEYILIGLFELLIFAFLYKVFKVMSWPNSFQPIKYQNKAIDQDTLEALALRLEKVMEQQKPYLNKKLKLVDLSAMTEITTNDLSQLFNKYYASGFYEFTNKYRLQHLEKLLLQAEAEQYTIAALAEQSGFNNKATCYKVFKEKHQLTPAEYIRRQRGLRRSSS